MSKVMEKEITAANKNGMKKRFRMYAEAASKLAGKTEDRETKGERR